MTELSTKIKEFILKYEHEIVLIIGFCLVSAISFEFGVLQGQKWRQKPLIIEKPAETLSAQNCQNQTNLGAQNASQPNVDKVSTTAPKMSGCAYVGSRSSNKFYLPTCSYAKRIKPENVVCFKSADEALGQGRTESKCN